ncbi:hypothetical protein [Cupriavidus sp. RAF12]|uniref:hypothetical protein n=1 Tax=Cupriavidus sp. RAF12 TaxID=3233050 RepID=UPI003F935332
MNSNTPYFPRINLRGHTHDTRDSHDSRESRRQLLLFMAWLGLCATTCAMATAVAMWAPF